MTKKIDSILKEVLEKSNPSEDEINNIENHLNKFLARVEKKIKSMGVEVDIFIGGSFAKKTMIRKDCYDIDVFFRFDGKHKGEFSKLAGKILQGFNIVKVHGSRDYFRLKADKDVFFEIIPVLKVSNPKGADNITDLSYSHVKYINQKVKKKILDEIKLAKVFCYANNCYGAESYIRGFSGYSLELLIHYYGGFLKFVKAIAKLKCKEVIDIEKDYKNKSQVLMDVNSSKLNSPIILIDPTYKQRNALAALSDETLKKLQKICKSFLKNPSVKAFEVKKIDFEKLGKNAQKKKFDFVLLEAETNRQEGDIAGSKLLKFYNHLSEEITRFFEIKNNEFVYEGEKTARYFFAVKSRGEILHDGPMINDVNNVKKFRKEHAKAFIKSHKVYAKEKISFSFKEFIEKWKVKNKTKIREMGVVGMKGIN